MELTDNILLVMINISNLLAFRRVKKSDNNRKSTNKIPYVQGLSQCRTYSVLHNDMMSNVFDMTSLMWEEPGLVSSLFTMIASPWNGRLRKSLSILKFFSKQCF